MTYYLVLTLATLMIAGLGIAVWRRTRQVAFLIGFAFLYYWTLYGGWLVVNRGLGSERSYRFEYLLYRMFPVYLDEYYLMTLLLYAGFVVAVQVTVLAVARRPPRDDDTPAVRIQLSHGVLLLLAVGLTVAAYVLAWRAVAGAVASMTPAYGALSVPGLVILGTVYQIFHQSALSVVLIGVSVYLSGGKARYLSGTRGAAAAGYAVVLTALVVLSLAMGNRSMMVFASVGAGTFYLANTYRPNRFLIASAAVVAVMALSFVGIVRGTGGVRELGSEDVVGKMRYVVTDAMSQDVEAFAAHASMYGTLQKHVPLMYGGSLVWLATAVVPAVVRPALVPTSYEYYAAQVGLAQGQGFNVHYATSWYLNFGVLGVLAGALVMGWIWAALFNAFVDAAHPRSHVGRVFTTIGFWCFTAYLPILIRSGIEGFKGVAIESLLIPTLLVVAASTRVGRLGSRLRLIPAVQADWSAARRPAPPSGQARSVLS